MKVIKIESCPECPYRKMQHRRVWDIATGEPRKDVHFPWCNHVKNGNIWVIGIDRKIDKRTKTFPNFCPLEKL